jgi:DNA (cytosine-5)-methyltransferase 1
LNYFLFEKWKVAYSWRQSNKNAFHCEWNEFGQKILKQYWPNAESYGDITKTDFTIWKNRIDVLTGGFPCQPYSLAGKRKGNEDERHLWPEMLRAIREISPRYIVGENVYGLVNWNGGLVFHEVQTDLENEGYEIQPVILPACAINAPHRRDRIWFVAYAMHNTTRQARNSNTNERSEFATLHQEGQSGERQAIFNNGLCNIQGISTDKDNQGLQRSEEQRSVRESWQKRNKQPSRFFQPNWENFPTQSPICGGNDGISNRMDRIKGLGNAIVPQVALQIFKAINMHEVSLSGA